MAAHFTRSANQIIKFLSLEWDQSDPTTLESEERALHAAEKELGISGRIVDWEGYIKTIGTSNKAASPIDIDN